MSRLPERGFGARLAFDGALLGAVVRKFSDAVLAFYKRPLVGTTLYFASQPAEAGAFTSLHRVTINDGGLAGPVTAVPGINTAWDVTSPVVSADELTIWFSRRTTGAKVYVATRTVKTISFDTASEVTQANIKSIAVPSGVSANGCELYLQIRSDNERFSLYRARRTP